MTDSSRDREKARENLERYIYARDNGHTDYVHKANLCENYFAGIQWEDSTLHKLRLQQRPALTINKILPTVNAVLGEYIRNRADVAFRPSRGGVQEVAETLSRVYRQIAEENDMTAVEMQVFEDGIITSRGYFDVQIGFADHLEGEVNISPLNPRNVLPDVDADSPDPDHWNEVTITKWLSPLDIEGIYGAELAKEVQQIVGSEFTDLGYDFVDQDSFGGHRSTYDRTMSAYADPKLARRYRILERQHRIRKRMPHFVDLATGDIRVIPNGWGRNKIANVLATVDGLDVVEMETDIIRWTVSSGHVLLHDEDSPYKFFTVVPYFPYFRRGRTIGLVENLISPQDMYNKLRSQELHTVNSTANSGWIVEEDSLANMDETDLELHGSKTGVVIVRKKNSGDKAIERIQPNNIPQGLDRLSSKSDQDIADVSGVGDSMRGMDRSDVSARAIEQKQQAGSVNLSKPFESLTYTRKLLAKRVLNLVQTYYTEPRIIRFTGSDLNAQTEEIEVNTIDDEGQILNDLTLGEYDVTIVPIPLRSTHDDTQFEEAMRLREAGIPIPDDVIIEYSHLTRKKEIAERVREISGTDMSDEHKRQMEEIEARRASAETAKIEAQVRDLASKAQLTQTRAHKLLHEMQNPQIDPEKLEKLMLEAEKMDREFRKEMETLDLRWEALNEQARETDLKYAMQEREQILDAAKTMDELRERRREQEQAQRQTQSTNTQQGE